MDSDLQQQQIGHHFQGLQRQLGHQKQHMGGLTRFRSAPSSYFASFLDTLDTPTTSTGGGGGGGGGAGGGDFLNYQPLSPDSENIVARFMSTMDGTNDSTSSRLCDIPENSPVQSGFMAAVKQEPEPLQQQSNYSTSSSQMMYHNQSKPPLQHQVNNLSSSWNSSAIAQTSRGADSSLRAMGSMAMDSVHQMKVDGTGGVSLTRHSSSPAGFFANINIDNGLNAIRGMGNYGAGSRANEGASFSTSRLQSQINFSSAQQSSSTTGLMTQNSDGGGKIMRMSSLDDRILSTSRDDNDGPGDYLTGFQAGSWDDSILSAKNTFSELNASENQKGESGNRPHTLLAHHLSLPKTSAETSTMEKLLQFQDSVPCKLRAKRGCATHPRSIAERARRTRISERMRKLQDLVPNMDKQTNTADMLDLAVEYIKDLQNHVKTLEDTRSKCTCST